MRAILWLHALSLIALATLAIPACGIPVIVERGRVEVENPKDERGADVPLLTTATGSSVPRNDGSGAVDHVPAERHKPAPVPPAWPLEAILTTILSATGLGGVAAFALRTVARVRQLSTALDCAIDFGKDALRADPHDTEEVEQIKALHDRKQASSGVKGEIRKRLGKA